ncbi:aminoglycoside 6-adenylyltransferase [bacterium]|nr:aminoglycoside 6-adenylyltransferase [bacterium]
MQKITKTWISEILAGDESIKGLVLIGSHAQSDVVPDEWSDLDLVVVVDDKSVDHYYPTTDWTTQFGDLYAFHLSSGEYFSAIRVQYTDAQRIDFVIIPESSLKSINHWTQNPLQFENRCLFSRSPLLDQVLRIKYPEHVQQKCTSEQFERIANDFWFKGMLAVTKAARNELLIALHLALDMIRDCLVLSMMIRDQATGTNHHRDGSMGNHFIELLNPPLSGYTALEILSSIERSAISFECLAAQMNSDYEDHRKPLLDYIVRVRTSLLRNVD